jgi:hypothetical protein
MSMPEWIVRYRGLFGPVVVLAIAGAAMLWSPIEPVRPPVVGASGLGIPIWHEEDWEIFERTVRWAGRERLDTLPIGDRMAAIGRSFVGTAYVPQTLEADGPESLVINFRGLDCVTFVENVFTLARFVKDYGPTALVDKAGSEAAYSALLAQVRYRDGAIDGYPSRLHYFSDWIRDNTRRGLVRDITADLGGVRDDEAVDFMTTHTASYRQLADPANVARVREAEAALSAAGRYYIPQDRIEGAAEGIRDGDVIAATSTVEGLDVAHTGLALWVDGTLRLMHAPLVGDSVQISEIPLAERIQEISGQDGIMVARPLER